MADKVKVRERLSDDNDKIKSIRSENEEKESKKDRKRKYSTSSNSSSESESESDDQKQKSYKTVKSHVRKIDNSSKPKENLRRYSKSDSEDERINRRRYTPDRRRRSRSRSRSYERRQYRSYYDVDSPPRNRSRYSRSRTPDLPPKEPEVKKQKKPENLLTMKTGGAYIPPAKLRMMQAEITDKTSEAYQRISWEALKKSIHGYINKVNVDNIGVVTRELLRENIIRGRGLLCRSIIQAQTASPTFTHVYAALVAIINSKFPSIGELLLNRLVLAFKRGFRRNDKVVCVSASKFIAHLVNQRVAHEILALEILTLLVETPTDDSVEVAIAFLKECGQKLTEVTGKGVIAIFEMLKNILHEGKLEKRVQYMIEVIFQVRKDGYKDHVPVLDQLNLVEEDDQFTHLIMLEDAKETQDILSKFKHIYKLY
jgi:pre-mRNA-splicing factor CWC22